MTGEAKYPKYPSAQRCQVGRVLTVLFSLVDLILGPGDAGNSDF